MSHRPLQRLGAGLLFAIATFLSQSARGDSVLWYNGNFDGRDALTNQVNNSGDSNPVNAKVYDDFVVPVGSTWTISSVYSNDQIANGTGAITSAAVEIRSGMSAGNGGTLIASLTGTATETATGTNLGFQGNFATEQTIAVSGLNIVLGPGTYYLSVAPIGPSGAGIFSAISTTSGAGAIGAPAGDDGNSYFNSDFFGATFAPTSSASVEGPGEWDYSMGVIGTTASNTGAVPAPPSLTLMSLGSLTALAWSRFRWRGISA